MKKPRPDARLKTLPDAVQAQLHALYQKKSGGECLAWLRENHGVKSSAGALSDFSAWYPFSRPLELSARFADQMKAALKADPELHLNAAQLSTAAQVAFEQQALQMQNLDGFVALRKLRLQESEQKLAERRVALLEKKAAQADEAESLAGNETLTDEERTLRLRQIFRM
jgi:hypothetical protein